MRIFFRQTLAHSGVLKKITGYKEETLLTNKNPQEFTSWEHAQRRRGKGPLLKLQWLQRPSVMSKYQVAKALYASLKL